MNHTWPATLLVTETFDVKFVNSGRLRYTRYESGCDDWRRGTDLSWVMGAECVCFSLVLHVAGWWWAHTRDKPHSEPALHNVSLGCTELILGGDRDRAVFQLPIGHTPSLEDRRDPLQEDVPSTSQHWQWSRCAYETYVHTWSLGGGRWGTGGDCDVKTGLGASGALWQASSGASPVLRKDT